MIEFGYFALCLALLTSGYALLSSLAGGRSGRLALVRSAENAMLATCLLLTLAVCVLWHALLTHNFQVRFVAENSNLAMPFFYTITSLWGGQAGSLLFWGWILSLYIAAVVLAYRHRYRELMPYAVSVMAASSFFFCILHLFSADPFVTLPFKPEDGRGLNPLLQQPLMAIHPPLLYLGMIGMVVPFAFAMAALGSGHLDSTWLRPARRWMLIPWAFLGAGLLLGGKWAYVELGWGGYWGWDPVENSSLMPWLAGTAFLHSVMVQERKGMLKVWNMILAILCYGLCILGTFITRSGIISSVHAFAKSNIGPFFAVFLVVMLIASFGLLYLRLPQLKPESRLESFASRETAFLLNNWILLGILFAVLWGTLFPLISEAFTGQQITVGPPFFNQVNVPIGLVLILLTGAGPLFAWRRTSEESLKKSFAVPIAVGVLSLPFLLGLGVRDLYALTSLVFCAFVTAAIVSEYHAGTRARMRSTGEGYATALYRLSAKNRRRYGGYMTHLALVLLFVGFTGKAFTSEVELVLDRGETVPVGEYELTYETMAFKEDANMSSTAAALTLSRDGQRLGTLLPERRYYKSFDQGTTEVSIFSDLREDFYLILVGSAEDGSAKFQVYINPLVNFVWLGSIVLILGSIWAMWPTARDRRIARIDRSAAATPLQPSPVGT
ncbi:MAG: heme lyase CcmF/NrfE family subunit [Candidatus Latescibacterota bacterium]